MYFLAVTRCVESVHVTVSPGGSVAVSPEMVIADVGGTVTFNCSAQGGPDNTYQWQNDGEDLMNETDTNSGYEWGELYLCGEQHCRQ